MLRKVFLIGMVTLVVAVPAQANRGKELRISGSVVRASAQAVSVENRVGDAVLTCTSRPGSPTRSPRSRPVTRCAWSAFVTGAAGPSCA